MTRSRPACDQMSLLPTHCVPFPNHSYSKCSFPAGGPHIRQDLRHEHPSQKLTRRMAIFHGASLAARRRVCANGTLVQLLTVLNNILQTCAISRRTQLQCAAPVMRNAYSSEQLWLLVPCNVTAACFVRERIAADALFEAAVLPLRGGHFARHRFRRQT